MSVIFVVVGELAESRPGSECDVCGCGELAESRSWHVCG